MKKLLLALVLVLAGTLTASAALITTEGTKPSVGSGSGSNPYEIRTPQELLWFVRYFNEGKYWFYGGNVKLMSDIDLSGLCGEDKGSWIPLGFPEKAGYQDSFCTCFDGNGHKITGLFMDGDDFSKDQPIGLIATASSGCTIKNLTVEGTIKNPTYNTGALLGYGVVDCEVTIENCVSKVNFEVSDNKLLADHFVGGILGYYLSHKKSRIVIRNCAYDGTMNFTTQDGAYAGGIAGEIVSPRDGIQYCSSNTHNGHPMLGECRVGNIWFGHGPVSHCISDGPIVGHCYSWGTDYTLEINDCYYGSTDICVKDEMDNNRLHATSCYQITDANLTSGKACYDMNERIGSRVYSQTLSADNVPIPTTPRSRVYKVKNYTDCQNYVDAYNNTGEDITTNRNHTFVDGSAPCSNCSAANPSSHAHEGEYYTLATKADVQWFWGMVNEQGITNLKVRLTADIDMENEQLAPIKVFTGEIDGAGHTLSNLNISSSRCNDAGLVGCLKDGGSIHDLTISGIISASSVHNVGAFAGRVLTEGTLQNLRSDCRVFVSGETMSENIGGIVGYLTGTAQRCFNNGPVTEMSKKYSYATVYIAGVVGFAEGTAKMSQLVNNALVGVTVTDFIYSPLYIYPKAIANYKSLATTPMGMYYVSGYNNPGYTYFGSSTCNNGEEAITQIMVGSGELCCRILNNNGTLQAFGQTLGTDFVPYPGISDAHKRVYNNKRYINCTDTYFAYSNSSVDETPKNDHEYNSDRYCTRCYHADVTQDANGIYQIASADDWSRFSKSLNAAYADNAPARFASAALTADIELNASNFTKLDIDLATEYANILNLLGNIYGNGHTMTFTEKDKVCHLVATLSNSGSISDLNVKTGSSSSTIVKINQGKVANCSTPDGLIYSKNYGLVSDCFTTRSYNILSSGDGYLVRCLQFFNNEYILRSKTAGSTECFLKEVFTADQASSGELAYYISHLDSTQPCVWGQTLGTDAAPKLCYGQTKTFPTFVTSVTSYSVANPAGVAEYYNAGKSIEATDGCFKVCNDTEPWTTKLAYNFIIDNGNGTYTADEIRLSPDAQHYLPIAVQAVKFSYSKSYSAGEIVSLVLPVDMPMSNINGKVYLFDGYEESKSPTKLVFTSDLNGMEYVPTNTPMLIKATGGSILKADLPDVFVESMTEPAYVDQEYNRHLTSYKQESVPTSRKVEDELYVDYYVMNAEGTKAVRATAGGVTSAGQLQAYFRIPCLSSAESPADIDIELSDTRNLRTASGMEVDLFSLPYGKITDGVWSKVAQLNGSSNPTILYGNDINQDNYADLTPYDFMVVTGKPNQTYYFYFNGSTPTAVVLDGDGEGFVDIPSCECHLRGIRVADGQEIASEAVTKVYKLLWDEDYHNTGLALSGYGELADEHKGYPLYDATGITSGINLSLTNPNALVIGGPNVRGVTNRIVQTENVMQGFTAQSLSITDGKDFCYDFSVLCPNVSYTRNNIAKADAYATAVLPFAVNATEGVYKYVNCDGNKVYFETPATATIPAYTPIVVDVTSLSEITLSGANLQALIPNGTFNLTDATSSTNGMKYGFVTKRQTNVSVTENEEVSDYNVYGYSTTAHQFVRTTKTFSISPFRAFFLLPKSAQARANGSAAPASAPSALTIVIDGKEIGDANGIVDVELSATKTKTKTKTYNLLGQPVGSDYKGIVIQDGKRTIVK